MEAAFKAQDEY